MLSTLLAAGGLVLVLGGAVAGVIYYLRRSANTAADLRTADATLQAESDRVAQLERAEQQERARRAAEFNAKAAAVVTDADADKLLRDTAAAGKSPANTLPSTAH